MTTTISKGGPQPGGKRLGLWLLALAALSGCAMRDADPDPAMLGSLTEMEARIALLQDELVQLRQSLRQEDLQRNRDTYIEREILRARLEELQQRIAGLPGRLESLCPTVPAATTVNAQCEGPDVQRVVVSGDKLVVGELERIWLEPPAMSVVARIDAASARSLLHADQVVEFERDGNRWVRFDLTIGEETLTVERPVTRTVRMADGRKPMVALRVQLGDVRETVEFALLTPDDPNHAVVLGRNFLTDVALVDVARKYVQPAFQSPNG